ncbi:MAG TPA: glycosyltransferase family 4 protein [Ktedonobacteraceae bacterium]|nr:glycosyltransferase family 4 protein [Ktedonobacteraceae bacterium]
MKDRIRVCYVSFSFSPLVGGAEVRAEKQARRLQALGHEVIVVTLRHDKRWKRTEMLDGLPVIRVGGIYKRGQLRIGRLGHLPIFITMFLTLWRMRYSYEVIHALQLSPAAAFAGKFLRKPVILSVQCAGPSETQLKQLERGARLMVDTLTETSFLMVDTRDWAAGAGDIAHFPQLAFGNLMLSFLRKSNASYQILSTRSYSYLTSHGFHSGQIVHISGSVDTEKFQPSLERRPDPAKQERDIICVARLDYAKGVDVLLHAWGRMIREPAGLRAYLKPRLRLVGDGVYRAQMERIVAELRIQDSVEFLGSRADVVDLLQRSWGFVLPSRWEGMSNALLEGMACGLPCVATRVSGSEDAISDGVNGLLVEPEQPAEMALALRRIMEDADFAQRLGREARATVVRDYQLAAVVEQCLGLYRRLLTGEQNVLPLVLERRGN